MQMTVKKNISSGFYKFLIKLCKAAAIGKAFASLYLFNIIFIAFVGEFWLVNFMGKKSSQDSNNTKMRLKHYARTIGNYFAINKDIFAQSQIARWKNLLNTDNFLIIICSIDAKVAISPFSRLQ